MKQYTLFTDSPDEFLSFAEGLKREPAYINANDRLLLIFSQEPGGPSLHERIGKLEQALAGVRVVGLTMSGFPLPPGKEALKSGAVYTFLLFERSKIDIYPYDCRTMSAEAAAKRFQREIRYREHIAGILLFSAGVVMDIDRFLSTVSVNNRHSVPIIGAEAGADEVPFIFGDFGGYDRGIVALVFSGRSLHMQYNYDMGWKPIGKDMRITGMDGRYCVSTIDDMPAVSVYERYLGVEPDEYFVENVREFPLVTDRGERKAVRCPSGYDAAGKLYFIAKLNEGERVRLSYANPRRLLDDTKLYADAMKSFDPQALLLIICENRARFLGRQTYTDIGNYLSFAPQCAWTRGYAGIMLDSRGGGVINSAILSVGLREGSPRGGGQERPAVLSVERREGAIPLNERLARFLEQTTNELEDMAIEADAANSAKSSFLSNMSHEIRTPINAILGMNEMILRESSEGDILSYAQNIRIAGLSLLSIISDILDFSKIEAGKMDIAPEDYDVPSLVSDLVNLVWLRAEERGLALEVKVDPHIPHLLYGDEMRIKQIITNLLTNAIKYTEQGTVRLDIGFEPAGHDQIALKVSVSDTGYGIRQEDLNRLFLAFDRIDKERARKIEGTGLGLNITQQLLSLMGSTLDVQSVYGEGSTFSFTLLQKVVEWEEIGENSTSPHGERRKKNRSVERFAAPKARVLVVDDAPMNLAVISGLLKRTQMSIDTASGGLECIEKFGYGEYDLVFLDHRMPGMDGIETLKALRKNYPDKFDRTPIISLTANAVSGARELYIESGFTDYLTKPVMADELEKMIVKYLPPGKVFRSAAGTAEEEAPGRVPDWLASIFALDTEKGVANCGGVREYLEALKIFAESITERADALERSCARGDIADYTIKVHALKSMARSIGADELAGLAARLESAGSASDTDTVYGQTGKLLVMYRSLLRPLAPLLEHEDGADRSELSVEQLRDAAETLRDLAAAFDYDSVRMVMDELTAYRVPPAYESWYSKLTKAVGKVDWDLICEAADDLGKMEDENR